MTQQNHTRRNRRRRGMTLIEIMVVITILGLIAAAVGISVVPALNQAKVDRAGLDIKNIESALKLYYTKKGNYPDTGTGLRALVDAKIMEEVPKDPWGNDYVYLKEGNRPVITSYGSDGAPGGDDDAADISNKSMPKS